MRRAIGVFVGFTVWATLASIFTAHVEAQEVDDPLSPAGQLRIEASASIWSFDQRFGLRTVGGSDVDEVEPLGYDLNHDQLGVEAFPILGSLEESIRAAADDPNLLLSLGRTRADMQRTVIRMPIRVDLGITDWLTMGATVPILRQRTQLAFFHSGDAETSNLGLGPEVADPGSTDAFLAAMEQALDEMQIQASTLCEAEPGSAECLAAEEAFADGQSFFSAVSAGYAAHLFPYDGSGPAQALQARLADIGSRFEERGVTSIPGAESLPLAAGPLSTEGLMSLVTDPSLGVAGSAPGDWQSPFELGDVEVSAAIRLLEWSRSSRRVGGASGSEDDGSGGGGSDAGLRPTSFLLGAGALVRLPTGRIDNADHFFDRGSGDGQLDLEGRLFGDVTFGRRLGFWADVRYGIQQEGTVTRRVAPPELVFAPLSYREELRWTPGDYLDLEVAPRFRLTPELALAGRYRLYSKGEDDYSLSGPVEETIQSDPSILEAETSSTLHEVGISGVYSTLARSAAGGDTDPFEARVRFSWAVAGSGGQTPKGVRLEVGFRYFWSVWGGS